MATIKITCPACGESSLFQPRDNPADSLRCSKCGESLPDGLLGARIIDGGNVVVGDDYLVHFELKVQGLDDRFADGLKREGFVLKPSTWTITSTDPEAAFHRVVVAFGNPTVEAQFIPVRGQDERILYRNY